MLSKIDDVCAATKAKWRRWVPELRDLLERAYEGGHYQKKSLRVTTWRSWLDRLEAWADDPVAIAPFSRTSDIWERLCTAGWKAIWKTGAPPEHPGFDDILNLRQQVQELEAETAGWLPHAAQWVSTRVDDLRRRRGTVGFNGLLKQLDRALDGPAGRQLAAAIRTQFPVALVDEFQDTSPVQYRIFDRIYNVSSNDRGSLLALIGDPKQAIYRFRGADIHAYLTARRDCEARLYTLARNFRSSPAAVAAVNQVFRPPNGGRKEARFSLETVQAKAQATRFPFIPLPLPATPVRS